MFIPGTSIKHYKVRIPGYSTSLTSLVPSPSHHNFHGCEIKAAVGRTGNKAIIDQFPLVSNFQSKCQLLTFSSMISFHPCSQASATLLSLAVQKSAYNFPLPGIVACSYAIVVGKEDFTRLLQIKCFSTFYRNTSFLRNFLAIGRVQQYIYNYSVFMYFIHIFLLLLCHCIHGIATEVNGHLW